MTDGPDDKEASPHRRASDQQRRPARTDGATPRYLDPGDTVFSLWGRVLMARYRRVAASVTRHIVQRPLHIGISARIFHPEPGSTGLRSKNLQYLEESIAQDGTTTVLKEKTAVQAGEIIDCSVMSKKALRSTKPSFSRL